MSSVGNRSTEKTLQTLKLLSQLNESQTDKMGMRIAIVRTSEPDPITFELFGMGRALDLDVVEVPGSLFPLCPEDRLLVFPLVSTEAGRWVALAKLNGGLALGTMQDSNHCLPDGLTSPVPVHLPQGLVLEPGDRVGLVPRREGSQIEYYIMNHY